MATPVSATGDQSGGAGTTKLPNDIKRYLFDKYYNWGHKKDSELAKELLIKYGCIEDVDRRLPVEVRWFLEGLCHGSIGHADAELINEAKAILHRYPKEGE